MHYCHANTVCVNLPGSYRCDCVMGYVRVDDFSCTGELLRMYQWCYSLYAVCSNHFLFSLWSLPKAVFWLALFTAKVEVVRGSFPPCVAPWD